MDTREKLKAILTEWYEFRPPQLYRRDFNFSLVESPEILSIIGVRRGGKTYLCYQIAEDLKKTYPADNIAYINLEDERLFPLKGDELTLLWEVFQELFSVDLNKRTFLFVDEIQNAKNWSKWTSRITEQNKNLKLIITGSSSKLLSKEIATELRGRTMSFTVFPLSFKEYLKIQNIDPKVDEKILYGKKKIAYKKQFNSYLKDGGFPAVLKNSNPKELLKEYYKVMFHRDIVDRYKIKNVKLLEDYLTLTIDQTAALSSLSSTAKKLENFGYSLSKNTLSNFSKYAQEAFLIFEAKKYGYKIKEQLRAPKKIYTIDHGLLKAIRFFTSADFGRLLENIVYIELERRGKEIFYHQDIKECDFIIKEDYKIKEAVQVTKSIKNDKTKKRKIDGISEALNQYQLKTGVILTEDEHEILSVGSKKIQVLPLWYWLLGQG